MLLCTVASELASCLIPIQQQLYTRNRTCLASLYTSSMQHYAIKTIENIGSQAGEWATRFASSEVVSYLVTIWQGSKNDNIRATAASTLSRLMRHSSSLLAPTLEKYSLKPVVQGERFALKNALSSLYVQGEQSGVLPSFLLQGNGTSHCPCSGPASHHALCTTSMSAGICFAEALGQACGTSSAQ